MRQHHLSRHLPQVRSLQDLQVRDTLLYQREGAASASLEAPEELGGSIFLNESAQMFPYQV